MASFRVNRNDRSTEADVVRGDIKFGGAASQRGFHDAVDSSSDDTFKGPGHADIALKGGAARKDAFVRRGNMGMGAEDGRGAAVEIAAHELHVAGCFGVEIDEAH